MANTGDPYVYNVQQWVNKHFTDKTGYTPITENGKTGWPTIYALLHAFQISLGITATADNFGTGTANAFITYASKRPFIEIDPDTLTGTYETMSLDELENLNLDGLSVSDKDEVNDLIKYKRICGIIQGALLCKGYSIGTNKPTGNFYSGTGTAIVNLKSDAGLTDTTTKVTLNIMKALLSMDYFYSYDTSTKTQNIIKMQRYLNRLYQDYIGLCPCDGVYGRRTSKALVYALQAEEGMSTSVANGNFGPSTKNCCPRIPYNNVATNYNGQSYSEESINRIITLLNIALYMNGFGYGQITSEYSPGIVKSFQNRYALSVNGICDLTTWLSIFISSGDINRSALACDCATPLNAARAQTLYNNGYRYVGRYITGTTKKVSISEMNIAFNVGLRIFPIFQTSANYVEYFTSSQGEIDALAAYTNALELNIPAKTVIYFAVDCDPQDAEINNRIIPYFSKVFEKMNQLKRYKVGIYGTRNVCKQVSDLGYAVYSFVGDMSTGFSGNLGFSIPNNWSFDQFATVSVGNGDGIIEIDKDAFSGRDNGFSFMDDIPDIETDEDHDYDVPIGYDTTNPQPKVFVNVSNESFNVYSSKHHTYQEEPGLTELKKVSEPYGTVIGETTNVVDFTVDGHKVGEIMPGDLFVRYYCVNHDYGVGANQMRTDGDAVHKVYFRTKDGTLRYGYIQEYIAPNDLNIKDSKRIGSYPFYYYNFDPETNKLKISDESGSNVVYTVSREINYRRGGTGTDSGKILGTLPAGTKLKGIGSNGVTYYDHVYFKYRYNEQSKEWEYLDKEKSTSALVDLDMKNGVNSYDRALW